MLPAHDLLIIASGNGVYRSTDGGANFSFVKSGRATDLNVDTTSSTVVYASISGSGVFKSTDSGATFPPSGNLFTSANGAFTANDGTTTTIGYIGFAQTTQPDNQTMYANVQLTSGGPQMLCSDGNYYPGSSAMLKSTNGGASWTYVTLTGDIRCSCQCGYDQTIGVDPQDANRVYIGMRALFMATDGGAAGLGNANRIDYDPYPRVHVDQHALVFSPASHWESPAMTLLYNGTDGGIAQWTPTKHNGGLLGSWQFLNGSATCTATNGALATMLIRQIDMGRGSASNNAYTYGVGQDTGLFSHTPDCSGTSWHQGYGGDGWAVAVDPLNGRHAIAFSDCCLWSTTDGSSWGAGPTGFPATPRWLYFDPSGGKAYAVGNNGDSANLYRSTDNGSSFSLMHSFTPWLSTSGVSINIAKADPNTIWVGLADGRVAFTSQANLGSSAPWSPAIQVTGAPYLGVAGIAIDPNNISRVVVVYSSTQASSQVFMTTNSGASWANASGNLPNVALRGVVIDPNTSPHSIIVASDMGVMRTLDFGATWERLGVGLPTVQCTSLALDSTPVPSLLRVGTYGRSAWELELVYAPSLTIRFTTTNTVAISWPSPSTGFTLQENTTGIGTTNWNNVGITPTDDGTIRTVIIAPPTGNRFYRLKK